MSTIDPLANAASERAYLFRSQWDKRRLQLYKGPEAAGPLKLPGIRTDPWRATGLPWSPWGAVGTRAGLSTRERNIGKAMRESFSLPAGQLLANPAASPSSPPRSRKRGRATRNDEAVDLAHTRSDSLPSFPAVAAKTSIQVADLELFAESGSPLAFSQSAAKRRASRNSRLLSSTRCMTWPSSPAIKQSDVVLATGSSDENEHRILEEGGKELRTNSDDPLVRTVQTSSRERTENAQNERWLKSAEGASDTREHESPDQSSTAVGGWMQSSEGEQPQSAGKIDDSKPERGNRKPKARLTAHRALYRLALPEDVDAGEKVVASRGSDPARPHSMSMFPPGSAQQHDRRSSTKQLMDMSPRSHSVHTMETYRHMHLANHEVSGYLCDHSGMLQLLYNLGHRFIQQSWVDDIINTNCRGRSFLDRDDVLLVADKYRENFRKVMEEDFAATDSRPGCNFIFGGSTLLRSLTPKFEFHSAAEFLRTSSGGKSCELNSATPEDILNMRDLISDNAGFTPTLFARMMAAYDRYDRNKDGKLNLTEIAFALRWFGADMSFVKSPSSSLSSLPPNTKLDRMQFTEKMKEFYDYREDCVRDAFAKVTEQGSLRLSKLIRVFQELNVVSVTPEAVAELLQACGFDKKDPLLFEDVEKIYIRYTERHGFTQRELDDLAEAFREFDVDHSGTMDAPELEVAIRWLGYHSTFHVVRELVEQFDIDESGEVDIDEFVSFVSAYRDLDMQTVFEMFQSSCRDGAERLDADDFRHACLKLGYVPTCHQTKSMLASVDSSKGVDKWLFFKLIRNLREEMRDHIRGNECFTDKEVRQLRAKFRKYDPSETGTIANLNVRTLMLELFPQASTEITVRQKAKQLLAAADENKDGRLEFSEFLRLMRLFRYHIRHNQMEKERECLKVVSFSVQEVKDCRRIFEMFDMDASEELTPQELHVMLSEVVQVEENFSIAELLTLVKQVDLDGNRMIDFPEFLVFVQKILNDNWKSIKDISDRRASVAFKDNPVEILPIE